MREFIFGELGGGSIRAAVNDYFRVSLFRVAMTRKIKGPND